MKLSLFFSAVVTLIAINSAIICQTHESKIEDAYQNHQRAIRLTLLESEIKALEDAPMRCFARTQIMKFIYSAKVGEYFDTADSLGISCLEDVQNNSNQFSRGQASRWQNTVISLLRQNSPDIGSRAAKKYLEPNAEVAFELNEIESGANLSAITNRLLQRISKGDVPSDFVSIFLKLHQANAEFAYRVLDGYLSHLETGRDETALEKSLNSLSRFYIDDSAPTATRLRFLRFSVRFAQAQLMQGGTGRLFTPSYELLRIALPSVKESLPAEYEQAKAVFLAMEGKISSANKELNEAFARIEESKDKLQQAITEAEKAEKKSNRDTLWLYASQFAVKQKKFQIAAKCILEVGTEEFTATRDYMLLNTVLPAALKEEDFDAAEYLIKNIVDELSRSSGILKIASKYVDLGEKEQAFESLENALRLLRKVDAGPEVVRLSFSSIPIAIRIEKSKAFETASATIDILNRIPTPNVDDKTGTPTRLKYTDTVLLPTAFNVANAFEILAKSDVGFASSTAKEIQSKSWRLVAEIVVETERLYPLPKDPDHNDKITP